MKNSKMMEYVLEEDAVKKEELAERIIKRGDSIALVVQNVICLLYGIIMLGIGISALVYVDGFFDLIYKLCIIPAVLMPAGTSGVLKKFSMELFGSSAYNKSLTSFVYRSTGIIMPLTMLLPVFESRLEISFSFKNTTIVVCLVAMLANYIVSRIKTYTPDETKYMNILQGLAWPRLIASVGFYVLALLLFATVIFGADANAGIVEAIFNVVFLVGVMGTLLYSHENLSRMACICSRKYNRYRNMIWSIVNVVCISVPMLYDLRVESELEWWAFLSIIACPVIMMVFELLTFALDGDYCSYMFDDDKEELISGKALGIPNLNLSLDFLKIKSWNAAVVLVIFLLFRVLKEVLRYAINGLFKAANGEEGVSYIGLFAMIIVEYVIIFAIMYFCMSVNEHEKKEEIMLPTDMFKYNWLKIFFLVLTAVFAFIPLILSIGGMFEDGQMYVSFLLLDIVFGNLLMYAYFGMYLLKKVRAGTGVRLVIPCVVFAVVESAMLALEFLFVKELGFTIASVAFGTAFDTVSAGSIIIAVIVYLLFTSIPVFVGIWLYNSTQSMLLAVLPPWLFINYFVITLQSYFTSMFSVIVLAGCAILLVVWGILALKATHDSKKNIGRKCTRE